MDVNKEESQVKFIIPPLSKDWKLVQAIGGRKVIHAKGCTVIADWAIDGCMEISRFKKEKHVVCPECAHLIYATIGAKDYLENLKAYDKILKMATLKTVYMFYVASGAKTMIVGDRLYVKCADDNWFIDLSLGCCKLFHNDYSTRQRESGQKEWTTIGYHEHHLSKTSQSARFNEALKQISTYKYEIAEQEHKRRRKERNKKSMTFSEYDAEYWGFKN